MFESLALEDPRNTMRNWTTAVSFTLQAAAIGLLILAPIGYTQATAPRLSEPLVAPSGLTSIETHSQPAHGHTATSVAPSLFSGDKLIYHGTPQNVHSIVDNVSDFANVDPGPALPFGTGGGPRGSTIDNILSSMKPAVVVSSAATHSKPYPVSHLDPGMLIKQVQPQYPRLAQMTHVEGTVLLAAIIDTQGRITNLRVLSGHPLLIPAAMSAVEQWRYRPYILNGSPVEVETQISVVFSLEH